MRSKATLILMVSLLVTSSLAQKTKKSASKGELSDAAYTAQALSAAPAGVRSTWASVACQRPSA